MNRYTALRDQLLDALERAGDRLTPGGGAAAFFDLIAQEFPLEFAKIVAKLLPTHHTLKMNAEGPPKAFIRFNLIGADGRPTVANGTVEMEAIVRERDREGLKGRRPGPGPAQNPCPS